MKKNKWKRFLSGAMAVVFMTMTNIEPISLIYESNFHPIKNVTEKLSYWAETGINPFVTRINAADGSSDDPFYVKGKGSFKVKIYGSDDNFNDYFDSFQNSYDAMNSYLSDITDNLNSSNDYSVQGFINILNQDLNKHADIIEGQLSSIDQHIGDINSNLEIIQRQLASMTHNYRVANLYSLNSKMANARWIPTTDELPYVKEWAQVSGQFAAVDDATWNTNIKTLYNPGNEHTKRAYEILGYDANVRAEGVIPVAEAIATNATMTPTGLSTYGATYSEISMPDETGVPQVVYGDDIPVTVLELRQEFIPEDNVTWLDAVTLLYKALGQDQITYQSYMSYNKAITPETSAVYKGLSNIGSYNYTPDSQQGDPDEHGEIQDSYGGAISDNLDMNAWKVGDYNGFDDYIFVTRANVITTNAETPYGSYDANLLYWNKAVSGGFIYDTDGGYNKWDKPISGAEFMKLAKSMMIAYGEPEMSDSEQKALLQVYGSSYPIQLGTTVADAWAYLKCRGVLVDYDDFYAPELFIDPAYNVSRDQLLDVCMKIKDKDSRSDYKVIQITLDLADVMQENGYYPVYNLKTEDTPEIDITSINYGGMSAYTYLIRKNDYSKIGDNGAGEVCALQPDGTLKKIDGSAIQPDVLSWRDAEWYVATIPAEFNDDVYLLKRTYDGTEITNKTVDYIKIASKDLGGGVYNTPRKDDSHSTVVKAENEWYPFSSFGNDQTIIYYADANRAGKIDPETVTAKANKIDKLSAYSTFIDDFLTVACNIFMPMKVNAATHTSTQWDHKYVIDNIRIGETTGSIELTWNTYDKSEEAENEYMFYENLEKTFGKGDPTAEQLLNYIAKANGKDSYDLATDEGLKSAMSDISTIPQTGGKKPLDALKCYAYYGLYEKVKGKGLASEKDLTDRINGLKDDAVAYLSPVKVDQKTGNVTFDGDKANYYEQSTKNIQFANGNTGPAIAAREGTKEFLFNRLVCMTDMHLADDLQADEDGTKFNAELKSSMELTGTSASSYASSSGWMGNEVYVEKGAVWYSFAAGLNPIDAMSKSYKGVTDYYNNPITTDDDYGTVDVFAGLTTRTEEPTMYKGFVFDESDGTFKSLKFAADNGITAHGKFANNTEKDYSVHYTINGKDPEALQSFIAGIDETNEDLYDTLDTSVSVFTDAIMNRDEIMLVKWSDLVKCGYVIPTAENNMTNGPTLGDDGYYTFYTTGGRVRVNNELLTIQIGTTLFDLSMAESEVKPVLVYQGTKDESGYYDTYLDYRCVLGVASRATVKDKATTELLNLSNGNSSANYAVYKFDSSTYNSNLWNTQSILGYNFGENGDFGTTAAIGTNGYPVTVLKDMPYWDCNTDKSFTYGNLEPIVYWDEDTQNKMPASRFVMATFYPTANWILSIRDGGTEAIQEAKLYVYYPIQAFNKGFAESDSSTIVEPEEIREHNFDYWDNAPWHNTDDGVIQGMLDQADLTYGGSLSAEIDTAYSDNSEYMDTWWMWMTKYSYASQWNELHKVYISGDFVVRTFDLKLSSIETPDNLSWRNKDGTKTDEEIYRSANTPGVVYWVNTIGFIYNMPEIASSDSDDKFSMKKYLRGEYALPIAISNDRTSTSTAGIVNYNLDYYGTALKKGQAGSQPNTFEIGGQIEVPYGYVITDNGWAHYTAKASTGTVSNNAGLPNKDEIFLRNELSEGFNAELPFVISEDEGVSYFVPAPTGVYSIISGDHEVIDTSTIHTYITNRNQFYYGSRRIVLETSNNQDSSKAYTIVSNRYNPIQFNNSSISHKAYRVYRNASMDVFVMEHAGAIVGGVNNVQPVEAEDFASSEVLDFLDGLGANSLIQAIDRGSSLLIMIAFRLLPMIGIILMTILVGLAFVSDNRLVQMLADKFVDPIKLLTFGNKDIHNWHWNRVLVPCICLYVAFALFLNGNIIRLVMWIGKWYGIVSNFFLNR